jgi:hypothetical protein
MKVNRKKGGKGERIGQRKRKKKMRERKGGARRYTFRQYTMKQFDDF